MCNFTCKSINRNTDVTQSFMVNMGSTGTEIINSLQKLNKITIIIVINL